LSKQFFTKQNTRQKMFLITRATSSLHSSTSSSPSSLLTPARRTPPNTHEKKLKKKNRNVVVVRSESEEKSSETQQEWEEILPATTNKTKEDKDKEELPVGRKLAISAFAVGTAAFMSATGVGSSSNSINAVAANLAQLERESVDIDVALANEKPTVLEFYADWCEVCKSSAPYVFEVEKGNKKDVNFVMMNIDNAKWTQEMDDYDVDGIPHLEFLDGENKSKGALIGKFPKEVLEANIGALKTGEEKLPYAKVRFQPSPVEAKSIMEAPSVAVSATGGAVATSDPRAHG